MSYSRTITIGGVDYSNEVNSCNFSWVKEGGCESATLAIQAAPFDNFLGIEIGDIVRIYYEAGVPWWWGVVADLETSLDSGLVVQCSGGKLLLGEVFPVERFGDDVDVEAPTGLTYLVTETGGQLAAATYTYRVSSVDEDGETLCSDPVSAAVVGSTGIVDLSWDKVENATGYRVYRGTANPYAYWETSEITFQDDGSSSGTTIAALPAADTAATPSVAATDVDAAVTYLLANYLARTGLSAGSVTAGGSQDLDDYDLRDGSATLLDVLSGLADIVGDTVWGVDQNGAVYFVPLVTSVTQTYIIGLEGTHTDLVKSASRHRTRDGVSTVRVVGEDDLEDENNDAKVAANVSGSDDWPAASTTIGKGYWRHSNFGFPQRLANTTQEVSESASFFTSAYASVSTGLATCPELIAVKRVALRWNGASYDTHVPFSSATLVRLLQGINQRIRKVRVLRENARGDGDNGTRRHPAIKYIAGVKTAALAKLASINLTLKYTLVPDRWVITVEGLTQLIRPGRDVLRITTQEGTRYDLAVQDVSYEFESAVVATITAGDAAYDEKEEQADMAKIVRTLAARTKSLGAWTPHVP